MISDINEITIRIPLKIKIISTKSNKQSLSRTNLN